MYLYLRTCRSWPFQYGGRLATSQPSSAPAYDPVLAFNCTLSKRHEPWEVYILCFLNFSGDDAAQLTVVTRILADLICSPVTWCRVPHFLHTDYFSLISCSSTNCSLLMLRNNCLHAFTRAHWPMKCCASAMGFWNDQQRQEKRNPLLVQIV